MSVQYWKISKTIILNKKDRRRGLTALWNYLLKPRLHVDAIPLCLRQEQARTDFSENNGVSSVEITLSFGFHSVQFIAQIKLSYGCHSRKDRCTYRMIT